MRKIFRSMLLRIPLLFMITGAIASEDVHTPDMIRVLWTVSDYRILDPGLTDAESARALLGQPLDLDATGILFEGQRCMDPLFQSEWVDTQTYFSARFPHLHPHDLGIDDDTVEVVTTSCELPGFGEYLRLSNRRLGIFRDGIFLMFLPWVN